MLKTINGLKKFMSENCYNINFYSIGGNIIYEGYGIDELGGLFVWYYIERGERTNLKYFKTEIEIVEYAYKIIVEDKFAKSHLLKYTDSDYIKNNIIAELIKRKINYWIDEIPSWDKKFFRIFVVGCDIEKVKDMI